MDKILVTGGAGYIGSHTVVELHEAGYESIIIDNFSNSEIRAILGIEKIIGKKVKLYKGDCNDPSFMENLFRTEGNLSGCIHFAAFKAVGESVSKPIKYYENNVGSLLVIMNLLKKYGIPNLVFSSSCTVYGQPKKLPVSESSPIKPAESPYGNTKQICEEILRDTHIANESIKSLALRYFNPIGAHESSFIGELPIGTPNNLVPFITQAAAGLRKQLTVFGNDYNTPDGSCVRDYIHVVDLAKAHVQALKVLQGIEEASYYDYINIGTGNGNSVLEVIKTFEKATNQSVSYGIGPRRSGDVEQVWANVKKAEKVLMWKAERDLQTSLQDAWNWQKSLE
jgi:UDP-glucose 4-epimerase